MSVVWDFVGNLTGANEAAEAAKVASGLQAGASDAGVSELRRQFDTMVSLMSPFVNAGKKSLGAQEDLMGLNGPEAKAAAIAALESSPEMAAMMSSGENAMRQNATATGGLRGGNLMAAMAKFRPELLSGMIDQQFSRLGGMTSMGQSTAAGQAGAGIRTGDAISRLMEQKGAALAGGQLAEGGANRTAFNDVMKIGGALGGLDWSKIGKSIGGLF